MKKKEKITVNSSISCIKTNKINSPEIISHPKYKEIHEIFEKHFKLQNYFLSDSFNKNVWFLKDDLFFQKIINKNNLNSSTPNPDGANKNKIHEIISELNVNTDYSHLFVNVEKFIYRVVECLLLTQNTIERSKKTIETFNAIERKQNIEECINLLDKKIEKNDIKANDKGNKIKEIQSKVSFKLLEAHDFLPNDYFFTLKYFELTNINNDLLMNQKNISINKKNYIAIKQRNQIIEKFNIFDDIAFQYIDNYNTLNSKIKNNINSGTSFSSFCLTCTDNPNDMISTVKYESQKIYFLEIILNTLDKVLNICSNTISEKIEIKLYKNQNSKNKYVQEENYSTIILEINLEIDDITRVFVLRRLRDVFREVLETKKNNDDIICLILDSYFEDISQNVKNILNRQETIEKNACCDCRIF